MTADILQQESLLSKRVATTYHSATRCKPRRMHEDMMFCLHYHSYHIPQMCSMLHVEWNGRSVSCRLATLSIAAARSPRVPTASFVVTPQVTGRPRLGNSGRQLRHGATTFMHSRTWSYTAKGLVRTPVMGGRPCGRPAATAKSAMRADFDHRSKSHLLELHERRPNSFLTLH